MLDVHLNCHFVGKSCFKMVGKKTYHSGQVANGHLCESLHRGFHKENF